MQMPSSELQDSLDSHKWHLIRPVKNFQKLKAGPRKTNHQAVTGAHLIRREEALEEVVKKAKSRLGHAVFQRQFLWRPQNDRLDITKNAWTASCTLLNVSGQTT